MFKSKKRKIQLQKEIDSRYNHHIDTCIIMDYLKDDKADCRESLPYINRLNRKYNGKFSQLMFAELIHELIITETDKLSASINFDRLRELIHKRAIFIVPYEKDDFDETKIRHITDKIIEVDYQIKPFDRMLLCLAIIDQADNFVTTDTKLLNKHFVDNIQKEFKIKIMHPKDL